MFEKDILKDVKIIDGSDRFNYAVDKNELLNLVELKNKLNYDEIVEQSLASQDKTELKQLIIFLDEFFKLRKPITKYEELNRINILEIGIDQGHSLDVWKKVFPNSVIWAIDVRQPNREICADYLTLRDPMTNEVKTKNVLKPKSYEEELTDGRGGIDFLFIDGNHMYDFVSSDFMSSRKFMSPNSVIVFHDIAIKDNPTVEVHKFWNEIKDGFHYKEFISETGTGTGVIWQKEPCAWFPFGTKEEFPNRE